MNGVMVFLHILGAVIWSGGVIFIGLVAMGARRTLPERERTELFRFVGNGFLALGAVAAMLLGLSGNVLVEDLFGGWEKLSGEPSTLIVWKTLLFIGVLLLAVLHGAILGPRIRQLRLKALDGELSPIEEGSLRRSRRVSTASQILMLAGTIAILVLAADLIS